MFQIGEKIFYPNHGAGVIQAIEEKTVLGKIQQYCVINIPISKMDIMIPVTSLEKLRIRLIVDQKVMEGILEDFHHLEEQDKLPWKERFKLNTDKIKTGDMRDSFQVVHDLLLRNKEKSLNASEKKMLHDVQRFLISEMILVEDITENQAADLLKLTS
ncbi:CarD family transcriptional regulator [Niallia endozanthoxylica]|uniref:Transcription factor YdeB n=1 Tax=Niallia endozanthoxylica TaxID=2036016 RepID=A0A5J5HN06_9BACI|nr:CarD family transcriptional regulator [Niallia endozanthoxylica]KAA9021612.1 transcription factor YdeB [Niallia endozanthoxylica]